MRIGLVCSTFLPATGGMEWKVHHLATEYARRGHEVTVFAGRPRLTLRPIELPLVPTYEVVRAGFPLPRIDRSGLLERLYRRAILARHRQRPFDVLHCHHLGMPTRFGVSVKERTGVPVVSTTCGADVMLHPASGHGDRVRPWIDRVVRANVRSIDAVGAVNSAIHGELERLGTIARILDIPNGVDWDAFQQGDASLLRTRLDLGPEAVILLSVGRLRPVKGYELGIRAFARVARETPAAVYVLVGEGIPQLAGLVREVGLEGRVRLLDRLPAAEMPAVFRSADAFFSPSFMEGFSQVNAQAMASGLPCVISDAPGNVDAATGGGAVAVRTGDESSMAQALRALLADRGARRRLGASAHERSRRFAWSHIAEQYLAVFAELAESELPAPRG
jgi:glycosyltransferase involved in cell wall biosynthesis